MADQYRLILFEKQDDDTEFVRCSTGTDTTQPYLQTPDVQQAFEVDPAEGRSVLARIVAAIRDEGGWLSAKLNVASDGRDLVNRRALLEQQVGTAWYPMLDGVVGEAGRSSGSPAIFTLTLRDIRERERTLRCFTGGAAMSTATVLPRGVMNGYGRVGSGWLVPPTQSLAGTFRRAGSAGELAYGSFHPDGWTPDQPVPPGLVFSAAMKKVVRPEWSEDGNAQVVSRDLLVLWRPVGGSTWTELSRMPVPTGAETGRFNGGGLFVLAPSPVALHDGAGERTVAAQGIREVWMHPTASAGVPAHEQRVELMVRYVGPPTADYPIHLEMTAGALLRRIYDGAYSETAPRVRYDAARLSALESSTPVVRARITRPVEDTKHWVEEQVYRPVGLVPTLDTQGRVAPIRYALPDPSVMPAVLTGTNTREAAWHSAGSKAVSGIRLTYVQEQRVPALRDPLAERSAGDGIVEAGIAVEHSAAGTAKSALGVQKLEYVAYTVRGTAGTEGDPASGDVADAAGRQRARLTARQAVDRFATGGQYLRLRAQRSLSLRVGSWVIVDLAGLPDPNGGTTGTKRLAQVVSVTDVDATWQELHLADAGADQPPLDAPARCVLSANDEGEVFIPCAQIPAGAEVRVDYAISDADTAPADDNGTWTFLGRTDKEEVLKTEPLPAGSRVWVRLRSEKQGRRPSTWTVPESVRVPKTARVHEVRITTDAYGAPTVAWKVNGFTHGVRIHHAAHLPGEAPVFTSRVDAAASNLQALLPITVSGGQVLSVEVSPWSGWDGESVLGTAGPAVPASSRKDADDSTLSLLDFKEVERTATEVRYTWKPGPGVKEVWVYDRLHQGSATTEPWPTVADRPQVILADGETGYNAQLPPAGSARFLQFQPRSGDLFPGPFRRFVLQPVPVTLGAVLTPVVSGATASLSLSVRASSSAFPIHAEIMEDDPDGAVIATHTFAANGAIGPTEYPALTARQLPLRELRRWYARLTDAAGTVSWGFAAADRDALPGGVVTTSDYQARPALVCLYDDDTDRIRITVPGGATLVHPPLDAPALEGSGTFTYAVGDGGLESELKVDETRAGYKVEYEGGGEWRAIWEGALHGKASNPPTIEPRVVLNDRRDRASVFVKVTSPSGERVRLKVKDSDVAGAPVYGLVISESDTTPRYVESGASELGPNDFFHDGVGAPSTRLAAIELRRDQIRRIFLQAEGENSRVASTWVLVTLSVLEKPWLESVDLTWDEVSDTLTLTGRGGAHCASGLFQISADETFTTGVTQAHKTLADGGADTLSLPLANPDRNKRWYGRVIPHNGSLSAGLVSGLAGQPQGDSEFVPEVPRPRFGYIRQSAGTSALHRDVEFEVFAAQNQGGTLYVHTNKSGTDDANPSSASGTLSVASTPVVVGPATAFAGGTYPLDEITVWPGRGKTIYLRFMSADGGDTGLVPYTLTSGLDLIGSDGKLIKDAIDRPAAFAASLRPPSVVDTLPANNADGEMVFLTTDRKLYRWTGSAWTAAVPTSDLDGEIKETQIGPDAVTAPKIRAGEIRAKMLNTDQITADAVRAGIIESAAIGADQIAAGQIATRHLNVASVFVSGVVFTANSPDPGSISWNQCAVSYNGGTHTVAAGSTSAEVVWWKPQQPGVFQTGASKDLEAAGYDQGQGHAIICLNQGGSPKQVWNGTRIYGGNITTDAIEARHIKVDRLSAISANVGSLAAGYIHNGTVDSDGNTSAWGTTGIAIRGERRPEWKRYIALEEVANVNFFLYCQGETSPGSGVWEDKFRLGYDGSLYLKGEIHATNGTFTGTLKAASGTLSEITAGLLRNQSYTNYFNLGAGTARADVVLKAGLLDVRGDGTVYVGDSADPRFALYPDGKAVFSGELRAASGSFAGSMNMENSGNKINFQDMGTTYGWMEAYKTVQFSRIISEIRTVTGIGFYLTNETVVHILDNGSSKEVYLDASVAIRDTLKHNGTQLGFFGANPISKQTPDGSLASLYTALRYYGLIS